MRKRWNESDEQFLTRFEASAKGIKAEAKARERFVSNSEKKHNARALGRKKWKRRRAFLRFEEWRGDKFDGSRRRSR